MSLPVRHYYLDSDTHFACGVKVTPKRNAVPTPVGPLGVTWSRPCKRCIQCCESDAHWGGKRRKSKFATV